jgi:sensor histidine kinase regulating citrate/malate metabolism
MDDQPQKKSYKLVWIAGVSLSAFVVILGATFYLVAQSPNSSKDKTSTAAVVTATKTVATKDEVKKSLDNVTSTLKQAAADQAAAKSALGDSKNQEKVGS